MTARLLAIAVFLFCCSFLMTSGPMVEASDCLSQAPAPVSAITVQGQPNFATATNGNTMSGFNGPNGLAISPISNKLFAVDQNNFRVLRFASSLICHSSSSAEQQIGGGQTCDASNFRGFGIAIDKNDACWISDYVGNRVMKFDSCSTLTGVPSASVILGQLNPTTCSLGATLSAMHTPQGLWYDPSRDTLWVADRFNHRVLKFNLVSTLTTGSSATLYLGTSGSSGCAQNKMNFPQGVYGDSNDNLWVADNFNNRVLRFVGASTKTNGAGADFVLGQSSFLTCTGTTAQNGLKNPLSLCLNGLGNLLVGDGSNNRLLGYLSAASILVNQPLANYQIGQPNWTTGTARPVAANTLTNGPTACVYDPVSGSVFVSDPGSNRLLRYCSDLPTGSSTATATNTGSPSGSVSSTGSGSGSGTGSGSGSGTVTQTGSATGSGTESGTTSGSGTRTSTASSTRTLTASTTAETQSKTPKRTKSITRSVKPSKSGSRSVKPSRSVKRRKSPKHSGKHGHDSE